MESLVAAHYRMVRSGTTLHYWVAGPIDRPLVVFTHGEGMDHRMFVPQFVSVAREYRVLLWDIHGHGQSQPLGLNGAFPLRTVVDDLLALLDQLGYQQATFVGQSLGAAISQELAFLYPERVTALVVIDGTCLTMPVSVQRDLRMQIQALLSNILPVAILRRFIVNLVSARPEVRAYAQDACTLVSRQTLLALARAQPGFFHEDANYQFQKPFLLVHGEQDAVKSVVQQAPLWARREPKCRYTVVPQAGHNANQDNPAFFNAVLLVFLSLYVPVAIKDDTSSRMAAITKNEQFLQFLLEAKRYTYAEQGDEASVTPLLEGSCQLEYRAGPYFYRDIYFGMAYFVGQETVYEQDMPRWAMNYAGGVVDSITEREEIRSIYVFLYQALRQASPKNPYRGPREFVQGAFCYRDESQGDLWDFSGVETITRDDQLVYTLQYSGGFLR